VDIKNAKNGARTTKISSAEGVGLNCKETKRLRAKTKKKD
jgi:hypothetical protein